MRKLLLNLHLCAGLVAAIFLFSMGVSGAAILFENQIDRALNPGLYPHIQPQAQHRPLEDLRRAVEQAHPGFQLVELGFPSDDDLPYTAWLVAGDRQAGVLIDPYTAQIIPLPNHLNNLANELHQFHTHLLWRPWGSTIVGYADLLLIFLALSGLVLWWRRKVFTVNWHSTPLRINFDLHNSLGVLSSLFLLTFALTGVVICWEGPATAIINRWTGSTPQPRIPQPSPHAAGAMPLTLDALLGIAEQAVPGARPTTVALAVDPTDPVRVILKYPEDQTPAGRSNVYVDPYTGGLLSAQSSRSAPVGFKIAKLWNREIHTGDIFGWPTRVLACVFSLVLPVMAVTGPLIWWSRRRKVRDVPVQSE